MTRTAKEDRERLRFEVTRRYAFAIYAIKLGRVWRVDGGRLYQKRRFRRSAILIGIMNPLLRATGSWLLGLPEKEWLQWETQLAPITMGGVAHARGRSLFLPPIPGVRLSTFLADTRSLEARLASVALAAIELNRLHSVTVNFPDGTSRPFSHGDSHFHNVMYRHATKSAVWFDFEAVHVSTLPTPTRHADDWRAFAFSTAAGFTLHELPALAQLIAQQCRDPQTRHQLATITNRLRTRPDAFHLAQAHLDYERHHTFCKLLLDAFGTNAISLVPYQSNCARSAHDFIKALLPPCWG